MQGLKYQIEEDLFTSFIDEWDMTMCCPADLSGKEINKIAEKSGLFFPLIQDDSQSIQEHLLKMEYTPRSSRFGPYIDNVLGMNWVLPNGKKIKIGERVVKSTTGYDLFRFLLRTNGRFGHADDYVIRLRPIGGRPFGGAFQGKKGTLENVYAELITSSWSHWIDKADLVFSEDKAPKIEVIVNCQKEEKRRFLNFFNNVTKETGSVFKEADIEENYPLPWLTVKSRGSKVFKIAQKFVEGAGGNARILLMNAVILLDPSDKKEAQALIPELQSQVEPDGGHLFGAALNAYDNDIKEMEEKWMTKLESIWKNL